MKNAALLYGGICVILLLFGFFCEFFLKPKVLSGKISKQIWTGISLSFLGVTLLVCICALSAAGRWTNTGKYYRSEQQEYLTLINTNHNQNEVSQDLWKQKVKGYNDSVLDWQSTMRYSALKKAFLGVNE